MGIWLEKLGGHSYEPSEDAPEKDDEKELAGDDDDDDEDLDDDCDGKNTEVVSCENVDSINTDDGREENVKVCDMKT